jgi:hypothetical protein
MPEDLRDSITENAKNPKRAQGDAGSVEQHSLKDQIEADRYLASKAAAKSKSLGVKASKMVPPGSA